MLVKFSTRFFLFPFAENIPDYHKTPQELGVSPYIMVFWLKILAALFSNDPSLEFRPCLFCFFKLVHHKKLLSRTKEKRHTENRLGVRLLGMHITLQKKNTIKRKGKIGQGQDLMVIFHFFISKGQK